MGVFDTRYYSGNRAINNTLAGQQRDRVPDHDPRQVVAHRRPPLPDRDVVPGPRLFFAEGVAQPVVEPAFEDARQQIETAGPGCG